MKQWCSLEEVYEAYLDCRKRKRSTRSCAKFEANEMTNIYQLWEDLNNGTYTIGYSITFCVTRPKIREVFAADFRDRIVHHLLIRRLEPLFESAFIDDSYNCRKGKGTDYGVKRALQLSKQYKDGWVLICDLHGFFMSIDKELLAENLEEFLRANYIRNDVEEVIKLTKLLVLHKPQTKCIKRGNLSLWDKLDKNKSLFTNNQKCGLAIGNLTSQIFANFYLLPFDLYKHNVLKIDGGRYVDDDHSLKMAKQQLLDVLPKYREFLQNRLKVRLHPKKLYLQPVRHGFKFTGSVIKQGRIYVGNRTIGNAINMIRYYNSISIESIFLEEFVQRYNSYMGFMVNKSSYHIRYKLWDMVNPELKQCVYITPGMKVMKLKQQYKHTIKLLQQYGKKRRKQKRVSRDSVSLSKRR